MCTCTKIFPFICYQKSAAWRVFWLLAALGLLLKLQIRPLHFCIPTHGLSSVYYGCVPIFLAKGNATALFSVFFGHAALIKKPPKILSQRQPNYIKSKFCKHLITSSIILKRYQFSFKYCCFLLIQASWHGYGLFFHCVAMTSGMYITFGMQE